MAPLVENVFGARWDWISRLRAYYYVGSKMLMLLYHLESLFDASYWWVQASALLIRNIIYEYKSYGDFQA